MSDKLNPKITRTVWEQFTQLKATPEVNILDTNAVSRYARLKGFQEIADLIDDDLHSYLEILAREKTYRKRYTKKERY